MSNKTYTGNITVLSYPSYNSQVEISCNENLTEEERLEKVIKEYVEQYNLFFMTRPDMNSDERVFYFQHLSQKIEKNIIKLRELLKAIKR